MSKLVVEDITVEVTRKKVKYLRLSVHPPAGEVRLSVPYRTSEAVVQQFVEAKLGWIKRQQAKIQQQHQAPALEYRNGAKIDCLGRQYFLKVTTRPGKPELVAHQGNVLELIVPPRSRTGVKEGLLQSWYREQIAREIPLMIRKWEPVMGVRVTEWRVREMKTRWGSCNVKARRIWLNLELAKRPVRFLEYVVVHEMAHLLERRHDAHFKALMDGFVPEWRKLRKELNHKTLL